MYICTHIYTCTNTHTRTNAHMSPGLFSTSYSVDAAAAAADATFILKYTQNLMWWNVCVCARVYLGKNRKYLLVEKQHPESSQACVTCENLCVVSTVLKRHQASSLPQCVWIVKRRWIRRWSPQQLYVSERSEQERKMSKNKPSHPNMKRRKREREKRNEQQ